MLECGVGSSVFMELNPEGALLTLLPLQSYVVSKLGLQLLPQQQDGRAVQENNNSGIY